MTAVRVRVRVGESAAAVVVAVVVVSRCAAAAVVVAVASERASEQCRPGDGDNLLAGGGDASTAATSDDGARRRAKSSTSGPRGFALVPGAGRTERCPRPPPLAQFGPPPSPTNFDGRHHSYASTRHHRRFEPGPRVRER